MSQSGLLSLRLSDRDFDQPFDIRPKPGPSQFVRGVPFLAERAQGCKHNRLVLRQIDVAPVFRDAEGQHIALFRQAVRVCDVGHYRVEGRQNLVHPSLSAHPHDSEVEHEHVVERLRNGGIPGVRRHAAVLARGAQAASAHFDAPTLATAFGLSCIGPFFRLRLLRAITNVATGPLAFHGLNPLSHLLPWRVDSLVVGEGPARRQDLQTVGELRAYVDV
mmetsp:Transcript_49302/g.159164  ORF Transcript_49302/g.159164 Transcript_49302/m.159164 type:complete len:219 (+) Transcript_49302:2177-2833(+)